jgi:SAM-dependent methyltransferase
MLLTITLTRPPATDLGFLLHKHPDRVRGFELPFGRAHVFYPVAGEERCTAALLVDVDPVGLVRGGDRRAVEGFALGQYVNDRPYAASSLLSVAMTRVLRSAMAGRCDARPELAGMPLPLELGLPAVACRGGLELAHRLLEPLGWSVEATPLPLDPTIEAWGDSPYLAVTLRGNLRLADALNQVYVLLPVLDDAKHYFFSGQLAGACTCPPRDQALAAGESRAFDRAAARPASGVCPQCGGADRNDEIDKLLRAGGKWLASHPDRELVTQRYLRRRRSLVRPALARLAEVDDTDPEALDDALAEPSVTEPADRPVPLSEQRRGAVMAVLRAAGARRVLDLGCGGGALLTDLLGEPAFESVTGVDVSARALAEAARRLDRLPERQRARATLLHSGLTYRDDRLAGYDAAVLMEVVEHLDPPRLPALERAVFHHARPRTVVLTTPNAEYNVRWESLPAGQHRHRDHRFEWTRAQFRAWSERTAATSGYTVRFLPVGPDDPEVGPPTQMAVFDLPEGSGG